jgi:hypothetical protein
MMSEYSHVPIRDALTGSGATLAEYERRESTYLAKRMRTGAVTAVIDRDQHASAYISDNRWVADCPVCDAGIGVGHQRRTWPCWECGTVVTVDWPRPAEEKAIVAVLRERVPRLRTWVGDPIVAARRGQVPDTVESLEWENETYGLDHHSWTAPRTWVTAEIVTASVMNLHVRDNLLETCPALVTTAEDITVADGANSLTRVAKGSDNDYLRVITGSVTWST